MSWSRLRNQHGSVRKRSPVTRCGVLHRVLGTVAIVLLRSPILHFVVKRVGLGPVDANVRDRFMRSEIDDDPLRMSGVRFAGEFGSEIRIALPISIGIAVSQSG